MIIIFLGLIDVLASIFCIFEFNLTLSMIFASTLLLKGAYSLIASGSIFNVFGLIDIIAASTALMSIAGFQAGFFLNFIFIIVFLKGASSIIKL